MAYAYDAGMIDRILPRIKQYEATTGRKISQSMLDALMKGQLSTEVDKAQQTRALDLQESQFASQQEQQKKADKAAQTKGYIDTATTVGTLGLTYHALNKPSAMSELIKYQKGLETDKAYDAALSKATFAPTASAATPGTMVAANAPAYVAPTSTAGSLTAGASGIEYGSGIVGGQAALAGGAPIVGGQTALAGGAEVGSMAAYDASLAAGAAEGVGSTAGTTGAGSGFGLSSLALPVTAAFAAMQAASPFLKKVGSSIKHLGEGSAIDNKIKEVTGPISRADESVGKILNNILGDRLSNMLDVSVICSELLRQGHITGAQRTACIVFRYQHIPDDMFAAYLEWAKPIVAVMRGGGVGNKILLPFAKAFIGYMLSLQTGKVPTTFEQTVWKYAWWRCSVIARKNAEVA